jgi:hypothetical protein
MSVGKESRRLRENVQLHHAQGRHQSRHKSVDVRTYSYTTPRRGTKAAIKAWTCGHAATRVAVHAWQARELSIRLDQEL